jgi:hypothetical protein
MRKNSSKLVVVRGLVLSGALLVVACIAWSAPASAEFRAPTVRVPMHVGTGTHTLSPSILGARPIGPPSVTGGHRIVVRPIGRHVGSTSCEGGGGRGRFNHCDVDVESPPILGGGGGNGANNGAIATFNPRGGLPAPGEQRFVPDEVITEFSANTLPKPSISWRDAWI